MNLWLAERQKLHKFLYIYVIPKCKAYAYEL